MEESKFGGFYIYTVCYRLRACLQFTTFLEANYFMSTVQHIIPLSWETTRKKKKQQQQFLTVAAVAVFQAPLAKKNGLTQLQIHP